MRYKADSLSGEGNVCDYFVDKFGAEFKARGMQMREKGDGLDVKREGERWLSATREKRVRRKEMERSKDD